MFTTWKRFDRWLDSHCPLLALIVILIVLRLPNFFEPYWYGDEGIYLTLGTAMRQGEHLYAQIIDHKTPLIYYLAMVPNQYYFRLLNLGWMIGSLILFNHLAKKLMKKPAAIFASGLFMLFTTMPWFEGHIPNGELFMIGFVLMGAYFFIQTNFFQSFFSEKTTEKKLSVGESINLLLSGIFFSLGMLTKVPALFDAAAFMSIGWFLLINETFFAKHKLKDWFALVIRIISQELILLAGLILPIVASVLYFVSRGSGKAYLDFGLLYNFRYADSWHLPFQQNWLLFLFTLPGKVILLALIVILITFLKKKLSPAFQFAGVWTVLALVATTLSNRPYPHYFVQLIPPLALMCGLLLQEWLNKKKKIQHRIFSSTNFVGISLITLVVMVMWLLGVKTYSAIWYYSNTVAYVTGKISLTDYRQNFNYLMKDNYHAAQIIRKAGEKKLFIWGTNPMLYALSQTSPTGRFTVSFHIKDFNAYKETMDDFKKAKPMFVVIMKDETTPLPGLLEYLLENYIPNGNFEHFTLWKKQNAYN